MADSDVLYSISLVLDAGAERSRCWPLNPERQQQAEVFKYMAEEARAQALLLRSHEDEVKN